jgi:chemotaxis protein histidine kinase CheA
MAKTAAGEFTDPLADLRGAYMARLRNRVDGLSEFLTVCRDRLPNDAMLAEHHRCVHSMISSAAIFGHAQLSASARCAERAFEVYAETGEMTLVRQIEDLVLEAESVLKSSQIE